MNSLQLAIFVLTFLSLLYFTCYPENYIRDNPKTNIDYLRSAHSGLLRGLLIGFLIGDNGINTGIINGAIFAVINPIMLYLGY